MDLNYINKLDFFNYEDLIDEIKDTEMREIAWETNYQPNADYQYPDFKNDLMQKSFEEYRLDDSITLPDMILSDAITQRKSYRANKLTSPWDFSDLSLFLNLSFGLRNEKRTAFINGEYVDIDFRNYPSGGSLYPVDLYIYINNVSGIKKGFYIFDCYRNSIHKIADEVSDIEYEYMFPMSKYKMDSDNSEIVHSAFSIFLISNFCYSFKKYGRLSYKLSLLEAGHMAQNAQLVATAMGKKSLPLCGYFSDVIEKHLNIRESNYQFCVYAILFG